MHSPKMPGEAIDLKAQANPAFAGSPLRVLDVQPQAVKDHAPQLLLIDVRQPDEFTGELGHVPGAQLIVLDELPERIQELPRDRRIVFICRSGGRSARACALAMENNFREVYNMQGGMLAWNQLGFEVE
ncbi:MAG: rhodanese-like domain-containing protein [Bdellovibrio sp.]